LYNCPSRSERRQSKFCQVAEQGNFFLNNVILYKSEIKNLEKQGFEVFNKKDYPYGKNLYSCTISWEHAFGDAIPHLVYSYVHKVINTFPVSYTNDSLAKELFVIAKRALLSKI
jgi:hypothetical protein